MHTKLLGTDSILLGSCLMFLIKEVMPEEAEANLNAIWRQVRVFYKEHRTKNKISRLTINMVKHTPFPRLAAKAVETRDLLPAMEAVLRAWVHHPIVAHFHRLVFLSCKLDELVFGNPSFLLSADEREALRTGIFEYHQILTRLAHHLHGRGMPYVNFTPKNHYLCHLGLYASKTGINPRLGFCFQGEDFMATIKYLILEATEVSIQPS